MSANKDFRVNLAQRVHEVTPEQYVDPGHPATERHLVEFLKKPRKK